MRLTIISILSFLLSMPVAYSQCAGIDFSADITNGCVPSSIKFTAKGYQAGATFSWDFGGGFSSAATADSVKFQLYKTTGTFSVSLKVVQNGNTCNVVKNNYITISTAPTIKVSWDKKFICDLSIPVTFIDSSQNITTRDWIIDGTTFKSYGPKITYQFTSPGIKQLTMKVKSTLGCIAIYNVDTAVIVMDKPVTYIDSSNAIGCAPLQIPFTLSFSSILQTLKSYNWNFPGGSPDTSTQNGSTITYNNVGTYDVKLTITTNQGCSYKLDKKQFVKVVKKPKLNFICNDSIFCDSNDIILTNTTQNTNGYGKYTWMLPSGSIYNSAYLDSTKIKINITNDGIYDVGLKYTFGSCSQDTIIKAIFNVHKTLAKLNIDEKYFCQVPTQINFNDSGSYVDPGYSYKSRWKIKTGSGSVIYTDSNHAFAYTFNSFGQYSVELIVDGTNGCSDTVAYTKVIRIDSPKPKFTVNPTVPCPYAWATLIDATPQYNPTYIQNFYSWTLYDRDFKTVLHTDTAKTWKYFFVDTGYYMVKYIVYNAQGCIDSIIDSTTIYVSGISMDFEKIDSSICAGDKANYNVIMYPKNATANFNWEFELEDSSHFKYTFTNAKTKSFVISKPGTYTVRCLAYTNGGCSSYVERPSYLKVSAISYYALVDSFISCSPMMFHLKASKIFNQPVAADTTIYISWFADPNNVIFTDSNAAETDVELLYKGCYTVGFEARNADGCVSRFEKLIDECFGQSVSISADSSICIGDTLTLSNSSIRTKSGKWRVTGPSNNFQIIPSDTSYSPRIIFNDSGIYQVTYLGYSARGCPDSTTIKVKADVIHADFFSKDTITYCGPEIVEFNYTGTPAKTYIWDFGDGSPTYTTNQTTISHLYDIKDGQNEFSVTVQATNGTGCFDFMKKPAYIRLIGPIPFFSAKNTIGCDPLTVEYTNQTKGALTVYFYDDLGNIDSSNAPSFFITYHTKQATDSFSYYQPFMIAIDSSNSCLKSYAYKDTIIVLRKPVADFMFDDTAACKYQAINFTDKSQRHIKRFWDFDGDGTIDDTAAAPPYTYNRTGFFYPRVIAMNANSCVDTAFATIPVAIYPIVDPIVKFDKRVVCQGETVSIRVTHDTTKNKPLWTESFIYLNNQKVYSTTSTSFNYKANQSGNYRMVLYFTDLSNCVDSLVIDTAFIMPTNFLTYGSKILLVSDTADQSVKITWSKCLPSYFKEYHLYRTDPLGKRERIFQTNSINDTTFNNTLNTDIFNNIYTYQITAIEDCNTPVTYPEHANLLLTAKAALNNLVDLKWNPYIPWMGNIKYSIYRKTPNTPFIKIAETTNIVYTDKQTCDSTYTYFITGQNTNTQLISVSNTARIKPLFMPIYDKSPVKSVSVIDNKEVLIKFDTTIAKYRTEKYIINQSVYPYYKWIKEAETNEGFAILPVNIKNINRYLVIREDNCGYYNDSGLFGNNIYLQANSINDFTALKWNSYKETIKGVINYHVYVYDPEIKDFKWIGKTDPTDTTYYDRNTYSLYEREYCYKVGAVTKDYPKDTSYSSVACVTLPAKVFIANAFSPNGNSLNEVFKPIVSFVYGLDATNPDYKYTFSIHNRWGELIFITHDPKEGWDGTFHGADAPQDVYIYNLDATAYKDLEKFKLQGEVHLLR